MKNDFVTENAWRINAMAMSVQADMGLFSVEGVWKNALAAHIPSGMNDIEVSVLKAYAKKVLKTGVWMEIEKNHESN